MPEDRKETNERIQEELEQTGNEATKANEEIQDEFYSEKGDTKKPSSSPVPYVANNTAPLNPKDDTKKKNE